MLSPGADQEVAVSIFWSVYILERRSAIGLGVPFVLQDLDIDASLPRSSNSPYLEAMVGFSKLSGHALQRTTQLRDLNLPFPIDEVDYQDYKVLQWQKTLPPSLVLDLDQLSGNRHSSVEITNAPSLFLTVVLHARAHQHRSLIHRPVLYSRMRIAENKKHAQAAVDITKESVQFLTLVDRATTFVQEEPLFFRDFLISALAGILLAVSHAQADFSHQLQDEFFSILDLLRTLSSKSPDMARVWNTIKILETAAPRLGLIRSNNRSEQVNDAPNPNSFPNRPLEVQNGNEIMPVVPGATLSPMWHHLEQDGDISSVDYRGFPFTTTMFPTQLRNELSILSDTIWEWPQDPSDYSFSTQFPNTTTRPQ